MTTILKRGQPLYKIFNGQLEEARFRSERVAANSQSIWVLFDMVRGFTIECPARDWHETAELAWKEEMGRAQANLGRLEDECRRLHNATDHARCYLDDVRGKMNRAAFRDVAEVSDGIGTEVVTR